MLSAFSYAVPKERKTPPRDELDEWVSGVRPYGDTVIVECDPDEVETAGLIVRHVCGVQSEIRSGRVLAVGPGPVGRRGRRIPIPYQVGDRVCFARGDAYVKKTIAGREIRFLRTAQRDEDGAEVDQLCGFTVEGDGHIDARFAGD